MFLLLKCNGIRFGTKMAKNDAKRQKTDVKWPKPTQNESKNSPKQLLKFLVAVGFEIYNIYI